MTECGLLIHAENGVDVGLKIAFLVAVFFLAIWRIKKGFKNGFIKEIINILSIIVSCACISLVFLVVSSVLAHTFSVLVVCVVGLITLGIVFKLCNLIFKPITAILNISLINGLDKMIGAILGLAEAMVFSYFIYWAINYFGIFVLRF